MASLKLTPKVKKMFGEWLALSRAVDSGRTLKKGKVAVIYKGKRYNWTVPEYYSVCEFVAGEAKTRIFDILLELYKSQK